MYAYFYAYRISRPCGIRYTARSVRSTASAFILSFLLPIFSPLHHFVTTHLIYSMQIRSGCLRLHAVSARQAPFAAVFILPPIPREKLHSPLAQRAESALRPSMIVCVHQCSARASSRSLFSLPSPCEATWYAHAGGKDNNTHALKTHFFSYTSPFSLSAIRFRIQGQAELDIPQALFTGPKNNNEYRHGVSRLLFATRAVVVLFVL